MSNIVANPQHNQGEQLAQVLHIPIDSKLGAQELLRGGAERMLPTQVRDQIEISGLTKSNLS